MNGRAFVEGVHHEDRLQPREPDGFEQLSRITAEQWCRTLPENTPEIAAAVAFPVHQDRNLGFAAGDGQREMVKVKRLRRSSGTKQEVVARAQEPLDQRLTVVCLTLAGNQRGQARAD